VILVTSGAVGVGLRRLGIKTKPKVMVEKQAAAAVGQGRLIRVYDDLFSQLNTVIAQVLLTRNDLGDVCRKKKNAILKKSPFKINRQISGDII